MKVWDPMWDIVMESVYAPSLILYDTQGLEILASIHESAEKYEWY